MTTQAVTQAVVGINWGDEGKGRMIDYLATQSDVVVRYQGGNNAGHTVINEFGEFKLHLIPSGVFNRNALNILGPGMVINLEAVIEEMDTLKKAGISCDNIRISDRAPILFPFHIQQDIWEEERLGNQAYGSTKQGIAPAYGDVFTKKAILIGELKDTQTFAKRLQEVLDWKNSVAQNVYGKPAISFDDMMAWAQKCYKALAPYICNTSTLLTDSANAGKNILFEAQLGALRDIHYGIYPYTTSSSTLAGHAPIGGGLFGKRVETVMGVMKAYSTCVGAGPFVSEIFGEEADTMRTSANEFGATTGRPRRIGHFDAVASRYGVLTQGATEIALTKLDCLSGQTSLKVCTHYEIDGQKTTEFPLGADLEKAQPVYETLPGWQEDITNCRQFTDLPLAAQNYVLYLEELVGCPVKTISVGPERDCLMTRTESTKYQGAA